MRMTIKRIFCFILIFYMLTLSAYSHPGRTDSRGGHYVRTPGMGYPIGSYHYHDGGYITEVKNGIPQVSVTLNVIPSKLYPGDTAGIKVDMPYRFREQLELFSTKKDVADLNGNELAALAPGITTVVAYVNDDSSDVRGVEIFPFPEEIITLDCSEKFVFVGKPFYINYDVNYILPENAPSWNREPVLSWNSKDADILQQDDSTVEVLCKTRGEVILEVHGGLGGYETCKFKVYGAYDIVLWITTFTFVIFLVILSVLIARKHKDE